MKSISLTVCICLIAISAHAQTAYDASRIERSFSVNAGETTLSFDASSPGLLTVKFLGDPDAGNLPDINLKSGPGLEVIHDTFRIDKPGHIELEIQWPLDWSAPVAHGQLLFVPADSYGEPDDRADQARAVRANSVFIVSLMSRGDEDHVKFDINEPSIVRLSSTHPTWMSVSVEEGDAWAPRRILEFGTAYVMSSSTVLKFEHIAGDQVIAEAAVTLSVLPIAATDDSLDLGSPSVFYPIPNEGPVSAMLKVKEPGIYKLASDSFVAKFTTIRILKGDTVLSSDKGKIVVPLASGDYTVDIELRKNNYGAQPVTLRTELWDVDAAEFESGDQAIALQINTPSDAYLHRGGDADVFVVTPNGPGYVSLLVEGAPDSFRNLRARGAQTQSSVGDVISAVFIDESGAEWPVGWALWGENTRRFGPLKTAGEPVRFKVFSKETDEFHDLEVTATFLPDGGNTGISLIGFGLDVDTADSMRLAAQAAGVRFLSAADDNELDAAIEQVARDHGAGGGMSVARLGLLLTAGAAIVLMMFFFVRRKKSRSKIRPA